MRKIVLHATILLLFPKEIYQPQSATTLSRIALDFGMG